MLDYDLINIRYNNAQKIETREGKIIKKVLQMENLIYEIQNQ